MSTRSLIGYDPAGTGTGARYRYCHSDGYPSGNGRVLFDMCRHFNGDPHAMGRYLVNEHPGGWSSLGGDPTLPGTFAIPDATENPDGFERALAANRCYCHSGRPQDADVGDELYTPADLESADTLLHIEWVYVITPDALVVMQSVERAFKPVGHIAWTVEPTDADWTRVECGERFERCVHCAAAHFDVPDSSKRLATAQWLGDEPLDPVEDALGWRLCDGTPAMKAGHQYAGTYYGKPRGWYSTVTLPDGTRRDWRVCKGERTRNLRPDLTPIFPPTAATQEPAHA